MICLYKAVLLQFLGIFLISCNNQPSQSGYCRLEKPRRYKIENVEFSIPSNWYEGKKGKNDDFGFKWTNIKSPDNFVFGIQHYNEKHNYDLNELVDSYLNTLRSKLDDSFFDAEILDERKTTNVRIMGKDIEAIEIEYKNKLLNIVVVQRTMLFQMVTDL